MRLTREGFTLVELMIVVVIIGILAAVAIPKFSQVSKSAKEAEAGPFLKQLLTLQERHRQARDQFATQLAVLEGGTGSFSTGKYYEYELTSDPDGGTYIACARPRAGFDLKYFTIDQDGEIEPREGGCS
jgi:prepilin-type N-terminal cleavage/methylation domain-containing protein